VVKGGTVKGGTVKGGMGLIEVVQAGAEGDAPLCGYQRPCRLEMDLFKAVIKGERGSP